MSYDFQTLHERFINYIMHDGKKHLARRLFSEALDELKKRGEKNPLQTFDIAIENVMPEIEVRPKRIGGSVYQVPMEVKQDRRIALSFRWLLTAARGKKGQAFYKILASEIMSASGKAGNAYKKKEDVEKMAQANKTFAHLARF
jgi:small subunit ribosomal protein S7